MKKCQCLLPITIGCNLNLPVVINEMGSKHHDLQVKLVRVGFESEHDGGELGVVCSVTCCHTHSQLLLALEKINTQLVMNTKMKRYMKLSPFLHILLKNRKRLSYLDGTTYLVLISDPSSVHFLSASLHFPIVKLLKTNREIGSRMTVIHKVPLFSFWPACRSYLLRPFKISQIIAWKYIRTTLNCCIPACRFTFLDFSR